MAMITLVSGTNRPGSQTLRVTKTIEKIYRDAGAQTQILDLQDLPPEIFSSKSYAEKPAAFVKMNEQLLASQGVVIVTPEYNGSFPGVLKYFIDMLKFPESFEKRPVAFVGLAAGMWGALRSVEQLTAIFGYRNAHIFPERLFLPRIDTQLDAENNLSQPLARQLAESQAKGFIDFCARLSR
jgi:chromate reductase